MALDSYERRVSFLEAELRRLAQVVLFGGPAFGAASRAHVEAETFRAKEDAQNAYEGFVKDTVASIEAKSKEILNKSENKVKAEAERVETQTASCCQLSNDNAQLHQSCDFVLSCPIRAEEDAQNAYEDFAKDTIASIEANCKVILNNSENKANAEAERV